MRTLCDLMRGHSFRRVRCGDGLERIEDHLTRDEIVSMNVISERGFRALQARDRLAFARRMRGEEMAAEWEATHGER